MLSAPPFSINIRFVSASGSYLLPVLSKEAESPKWIPITQGISLSFETHAVDLAFAITVHKLQGQTFPAGSKLLLVLNNRSSFKGMRNITLSGLHVGLSRVRRGMDVAILPCSDRELGYLKKLRYPKWLNLWEASYVVTGGVGRFVRK